MFFKGVLNLECYLFLLIVISSDFKLDVLHCSFNIHRQIQRLEWCYSPEWNADTSSGASYFEAGSSGILPSDPQQCR